VFQKVTEEKPEPCVKCGEVMGHKKDCSQKYRSCWTYGIKKEKEKEESGNREKEKQGRAAGGS
jgi:hypothetical protein